MKRPLFILSGLLFCSTLGTAHAQYSASPTAPSSIFPQASPGASSSSAISPFPSTQPLYRSTGVTAPSSGSGTGMILVTPSTAPGSVSTLGGAASPALATPGNNANPMLNLPETGGDTIFPKQGPQQIKFKELPGTISLRVVLHKKQVLNLSLENALNMSLGKNISILIAQQNEILQRTDFYMRLSDLLPDITGEYRQSKLDGSIQIAGGETTVVSRKTFQPQVTANYTVYTGGRNIFDIRASKQRLNAMKQQTELTRQDTLRQVALAYFDLQAAYWQRSITLQSITEANQQVDITQGRFDGGIGLEIDALQAKSNLAQKNQDLAQAEETISEASENLAQLLNLDFQVDLIPDTLDASISHLIPEALTIDDMQALALKDNPRLAMLQDLSRAGKSDLNVAIADLFPQVDISAYRNRTGPTFSDAQPTKFYGIQASWNLLENLGFARPLEIRQANANYKIAKYNLEQGKRVLQQSIANSWTSLHTLENTVVAAENNYRYSRAAYKQAMGRLQEGVGTNVEWQLAQSTLSQARSDVAITFLNYNRVQTTLLFNLGLITPKTILNGIPLTTATNSKP